MAPALLWGCSADDGDSMTKDVAATTIGSGGATSSSGTGGATSTSSSSTGGAGGASSTGVGGGGGAGGETASPPAGFTSGSRLRARVYTGADGAEQLAGFYDQQLGSNCTVGPASDGSLRCLPGGYLNAGYFRDAGCTQRAALAPKPCVLADTYARVSLAYNGSCSEPRTQIFPIGSATSAANLYSGTPGSCSGPINLSGSYDAFALGAELPPSAMVAITETID